jgi:hypothetical protein
VGKHQGPATASRQPAIGDLVTGADRVFRRLAGEGWIVLSASLAAPGGAQRDLGDRILERLDLSLEPLLATAPQASEPAVADYVEEVEAWLDRPVRRVEVQHLTQEDWSRLGLLTLTGGPVAAWLEGLGGVEVRATPLAALGEGSLLCAAGEAAQALGTWVSSCPSGPLSPGLGWLPGAIILPGETDPMECPEIREALSGPGRKYALGLPPGAILAIGPEGEAEVWGDVRPTLALGRGWRLG